MKENYTDKVDLLITEFKKQEYIFLGVLVECIKEFLPISRSEIRKCIIKQVL